jgi:hypothetical protein
MEVFAVLGAVNCECKRRPLLVRCNWNGFGVYAIDATKKNLPRSDELLDFFEGHHHAYFPQMITGELFDVLAKVLFRAAKSLVDSVSTNTRKCGAKG